MERKLLQAFPKTTKVSKSESKKALFKKNCGKSAKDYFKKLDIYKQQINLTYKRDDSFRTTPGAFISLIVLLILLSFLVYRLFILFNKVNPSVSK